MFRWGDDKNIVGSAKIFTVFYSMKLGLDCYIFYYSKGSYIKKHKDPSKYGKQYRLNFVLINADKGGKFICQKTIINLFDRMFLFRADSEYHKLTMIEEGFRVMISFGFFIK